MSAAWQDRRDLAKRTGRVADVTSIACDLLFAACVFFVGWFLLAVVLS